jgi:hypothetical protein
MRIDYIRDRYKSLIVPTKHILKSKTFWVNTLTLVIHLSGYLPAKWIALVLPVANVLLRIVTTEGITFLSQD